MGKRQANAYLSDRRFIYRDFYPYFWFFKYVAGDVSGSSTGFKRQSEGGKKCQQQAE